MRRLFSSLLLLLWLVLATACSGPDITNKTPADPNTTVGNTSGGIQPRMGGDTVPLSCPPHTNTTAAAPVNHTVTLNVLGWSSSPEEDTIVKTNLAEFMKIYPNIKVNTWAPISTDYHAAMQGYAANNTLPDAFFMSPDMTPDSIPMGQILNLSPYMARDKIDANAYAAPLLAPFRCRDGQVYGLPKDVGTLGVFYNKDLFRKAGLPFPSNSWTWDDWHAVAQKLTSGSNTAAHTYGLSLPGQSSRWLAFLFANGGSVLNNEGTRATFNDNVGVDALNYYASFQREGLSTLPSNVNVAWSRDAFGQQHAAMVVEGPWLIPYLRKNYPNLDYGVAPLPFSPTGNRTDLVFTNAWAASATTKYPDAAWKLVQYMTSRTVQEKVLLQGFALPTLVSMANDPYFAAHPDMKMLFDAQTYGDFDYYGPEDTFIHQRLDLAISNVLQGKVDARTALDSVAKQIDQVLQS